MFNHKGGVAKTTTVFHLGWMLASKGYRVLFVDCDPQCNLSWMSLGYQEADTEGYPFVSGNGEPANIKEGLEPVFEARPEPLRSVKCKEVDDCPNLFLLPGHVDMARYENMLGIAQSLSSAMHALQNIPGSLRSLIQMTANDYDIHYVLIDMSPSLGPLNQNLLMSSEYFIIPMAPDYFADLAISSLARTIPEWSKWSKSAANNEVLSHAYYPWQDMQPKYIGAVIQNYSVRSGAPASAFQKWFKQITNSVESTMLPAFRKWGLLLHEEKYRNCGVNIQDYLLRVKAFGALGALSHDAHKPVFALSDSELKSRGAVAQSQRENRDEFGRIYSDAADAVVCLTS